MNLSFVIGCFKSCHHFQLIRKILTYHNIHKITAHKCPSWIIPMFRCFYGKKKEVWSLWRDSNSCSKFIEARRSAARVSRGNSIHGWSFQLWALNCIRLVLARVDNNHCVRVFLNTISKKYQLMCIFFWHDLVCCVL